MKCTMEDTPATRSAAAARVGPWFVLQRRNPTAPGLRHAVLMALVKRGLVTADSVVRGPTTQQLWRRATRVRGVARAFGVCWNCAQAVDAEAKSCERCGLGQEAPGEPDVFLDSPGQLPVMREVTSAGSGESGGTLPPVIDDGFESPRPRPAAVGGRGDAPEPIMSARELAAVFQLRDVSPPPVRTWRRRLVSALTTMLAVALVGTTAVAGLLYARPELRAPAKRYAQDAMAYARTTLGLPAAAEDASALGATSPATQPATESSTTPPAEPDAIVGPADDGLPIASATDTAPAGTDPSTAVPTERSTIQSEDASRVGGADVAVDAGASARATETTPDVPAPTTAAPAQVQDPAVAGASVDSPGTAAAAPADPSDVAGAASTVAPTGVPTDTSTDTSTEAAPSTSATQADPGAVDPDPSTLSDAEARRRIDAIIARIRENIARNRPIEAIAEYERLKRFPERLRWSDAFIDLQVRNLRARVGK